MLYVLSKNLEDVATSESEDAKMWREIAASNNTLIETNQKILILLSSKRTKHQPFTQRQY